MINLKGIDFGKCLDELEETDWGKAPKNSTGMVQKYTSYGKSHYATGQMKT